MCSAAERYQWPSEIANWETENPSNFSCKRFGITPKHAEKNRTWRFVRDAYETENVTGKKADPLSSICVWYAISSSPSSFINCGLTLCGSVSPASAAPWRDASRVRSLEHSFCRCFNSSRTDSKFSVKSKKKTYAGQNIHRNKSSRSVLLTIH